MWDDLGQLLHLLCRFGKVLSLQNPLQHEIFQTVKQHLEIAPAQLTACSSLGAPHDAEMGKTFPLGKEWNSKVGLSGDDQLVRIVHYEVVELLRDDEDLVVSHIGARTRIGVIFEVAHVGVETMAVVDVKSSAHEAGTRLPNRRHLDGNIFVVLEDPLGDECILGVDEVGESFGEQVPEGFRVGVAEGFFELDELFGSVTFGRAVES